MASDNKATSNVADGPVLTHINKRIRNLKKKLKRIEQLEDSIAQGRSTIKNKEQEELLKSKPEIIAVPVSPYPSRWMKKSPSHSNDVALIMMKNWDERHWIFLHGMVHPAYRHTLGVEELDAIKLLSSLMISRLEDGSLLSHEDALQRCIDHADHWIRKSDKLIDPNRGFTYADVREWLTMIMSMGYFKNTPSSGEPRFQIGPYLPPEQEENDPAPHRDGSSDVSEDYSVKEYPDYWEVDGLSGSD